MDLINQVCQKFHISTFTIFRLAHDYYEVRLSSVTLRAHFAECFEEGSKEFHLRRIPNFILDYCRNLLSGKSTVDFYMLKSK